METQRKDVKNLLYSRRLLMQKELMPVPLHESSATFPTNFMKLAK